MESESPVVVTECEGSTRWILCCNDAATRLNLKVPMNYTVALAIHPALAMLNRKIRAEQAALERLAAWAYQFSSTVILGDIHEELRLAGASCLWLEIEASLTLFGGFRSFIEFLEQELKQLGCTYQLGIGPTLEGAALLARSGVRMAVTSPNALFTRIRQLPLSGLMLPPRTAQDLHTAGVRTIGLVLELPRESIAKRFGPEISDYFDRLMGVIADPRNPFRLPEKYAAHFDFDFEVRNTEALLFPLQRMLREFAGYLRARDSGVQRFQIVFCHRSTSTRIQIGSAISGRSAEHFMALVRERMQHTPLPAPTISLEIRADEFVAPDALQNDLLNRSLLQSEDLTHTIDRISMRVGEENVHYVRPAADHRPEKSWCVIEPSKKYSIPDFPDRPLWLLPEPRALHASGMPCNSAPPERIESGWWDEGDAQRDYFVVHTAQGPDLWVFKDLKTSDWYLHGFWS